MRTFVNVIIILFLVGALGLGGFLIYKKFFVEEDLDAKVTPKAELTQNKAGSPAAIPAEVLANKFGFLSGGDESNPFVRDVGAAWIRPHPGPFLWDATQKSAASAISFTNTDKIVKAQQEQNYGTLATLWPFAEFDQKNRTDYANCQVSAKDEFLPQNDKKGRGDYLPQARCNPHDWVAYSAWIKAIVERYDGDGASDMPSLLIPIKYWEVMNEPDLTSPSGLDERLKFYKQDAQAYAELLVKTAKAIHEADSEAKILIAGAAGGNSEFLGFYREVFQNKEALSSFDIANVHCISNDQLESFNVEPYKNMLQEFSIAKPIWVTEAEAIISSDPSANATQTKKSTQKAIELGAEKIFFTRYDFNIRQDLNDDKMKQETPINIELNGQDPTAAYRVIIGK